MNTPENFEKSISSKQETYLTPEQYKNRLKWFRDDHIDELPEKKLKPSDENYHSYKCRGNYFQGVIAILDNMIEDGTITEPEIKSKVNVFIKHVTEEMDFSKFTKKESIDKVNKILDEVIDSIS